MVRDLGCDVRDLPGAGAAGGLGAGAVAFLGARIRPGIATVAAVSGLPEALREADACITGEGRFDAQSLQGKVVSGVAALAARAGVPVTVFAGQVGLESGDYASHGVREAFPLQVPGRSSTEAIRRAPELLRALAEGWISSRYPENPG
jgi:glycerate kinase